MKLSKQTLSLIIGAVVISLIGLMSAQYLILEKTIDANKLLFEQKVSLVSQSISEVFDENQDMGERVEDTLPLAKNDTLASSQLNAMFTLLIDSVFKAHALSMPYQYAIYDHHEENCFQVEWSTIEDPEFSFSACENFAQANLTCGGDYNSSYHLAMHFPNERSYLVNKSISSILLSLVFILIIMGCFLYAITIIKQQKKLSEFKNDFINSLTHEFKTPVFSVALALKTIKNTDSYRSSEKLAKYIGVIESENNRLKNQVDKILQLALLDSGNFLLEKEKVDIHDELTAVTGNFKLIIEERRGNVRFSFDAANPVLAVDKTHLGNVFYNLIDNALKYTTDSPDIHVTTKSVGNRLFVSFKDNGIGIDPEIKKHILEKFYRNTDRLSGVNGFGLGLYYCQSIIREHHGVLEIASEVGKGSEFKILLPYEV